MCRGKIPLSTHIGATVLSKKGFSNFLPEFLIRRNVHTDRQVPGVIITVRTKRKNTPNSQFTAEILSWEPGQEGCPCCGKLNPAAVRILGLGSWGLLMDAINILL